MIKNCSPEKALIRGALTEVVRFPLTASQTPAEVIAENELATRPGGATR